MSTINVLKTVLTAEDQGFTRVMKAAEEKTREYNKTMKQAEEVYKATRTPLEQYEAGVAKLDSLLKRGAIDQTTFNRAVADAEDAYRKADPSPLTAAFSKMVPVFDPISLALKVLSSGFDLAKDAAMAMADVLVNSVVSGIERLDALDDAANKIGVSTEALSALRFAAGYADVEIGAIDSSISKMNVNIGKAAQEGGKAAEAFDRLGLDAKKLRDAGPEKAFGMIADAINAIPNSTDRAVAANAIFSKSYREMIPLLQLGSQGMEEVTARGREMGQVISAIDASTAAQAADAVKDLEDKWIGLQNVLAVEVAPIVNGIAKAFGAIGDGDMVANARAFFDAVLKDLQAALNMADRLAIVMSNAFTGGATAAMNNRPLIGDMMMDNIEKARAKAIKDAIDKTNQPKLTGPDFADIGNDGASALGNTPFDREAERLRESLRTPLEVLQDELTKFGDMFAEGAIDVDTLNRALAKAEADYEKTLPKLPLGAGKMENNIGPPAGQSKPYDPSIAALEQGSAAAFSAINRARGGGVATGSAADIAKRQLEVQRKQKEALDKLVAAGNRKPPVAFF